MVELFPRTLCPFSRSLVSATSETRQIHRAWGDPVYSVVRTIIVWLVMIEPTLEVNNQHRDPWLGINEYQISVTELAIPPAAHARRN